MGDPISFPLGQVGPGGDTVEVRGCPKTSLRTSRVAQER